MNKNKSKEVDDDNMEMDNTSLPPNSLPPTKPTIDPVKLEPKPTGTFETKKHALIKCKPIRYFRYPICKIHKTTVFKLSQHFKL